MKLRERYTAEELKNGVRNPYYDELNTKITIGLPNEIYAIYKEIAQINDEPVEKLINRCLVMDAKAMQEHESPPLLV